MGDSVRSYASETDKGYLFNVTPSDWTWQYKVNGQTYSVWRYGAVWTDAVALKSHGGPWNSRSRLH